MFANAFEYIYIYLTKRLIILDGEGKSRYILVKYILVKYCS